MLASDLSGAVAHIFEADRSSSPGALWAEFQRAQFSGRHPHGFSQRLITQDQFATNELVPTGMEVIRSSRTRQTTHLLIAGIDRTAVVRHHHGDSVTVWACGESQAIADALFDMIVQRIPKSKPKNAIQDVQIWYSGTHGPRAKPVSIQAPTWKQIRRNYPPAVAAQLDMLMRCARPRGRGKLILCHGEAGTGKTTAIRALTRSWNKWCTAHYIADPENLFNSTEYLLEVLGDVKDPPQWRLLIAEDSDEFLRATARREAGAALGRLLNLSDGILGQGTNTVILLTTNDHLDKLHPALVRPGRCLAQIQFTRFTSAQATAWLPAGIHPPTDPPTLAELIEIAHSNKRIRTGLAAVPNIGAYL